MHRTCLIVLVAACGHTQPDQPDGDPPPVDAPDAAVARCQRDAPFGAPVALTAMNTTGYDEAAQLTSDELTMVFASSRAGGVGGFDIYISRRTTRDEAFGAPVALGGLNTADSHEWPSITDDGLFLYAVMRNGAAYDIMVAQRASTSVNFSPLMLEPTLNSAGNDVNPNILANHHALYFVSDRDGGDYDVYRATRNGGGSFDAPVPLPGGSINTAANDQTAVLTPDELTLYLASDRPGGAGGLDIYVATRSSTADSFGAPIALPAVNTTRSDWPSWISPDNCVLYITSINVAGNMDLYVAQRGG